MSLFIQVFSIHPDAVYVARQSAKLEAMIMKKQPLSNRNEELRLITTGNDLELIIRLISSIRSVKLWSNKYPEPRVSYFENATRLMGALKARFLVSNPVLFRLISGAERRFLHACPDLITLFLEQITKRSDIKELRGRGYRIGKTTRLASPLFDETVDELFEQIRDEYYLAVATCAASNERPLGQMTWHVLEAMKDLKAEASDSRVSCRKISAKAIGREPTTNLRCAMKHLKLEKYIETKQRGKSGGSWLTTKGQEALRMRQK